MKKSLVIIGAIMMAVGFITPIFYFVIQFFINLAFFNCCCGWVIYAGCGLLFIIGLVLLIVGFVMKDKPKPSAGPGPPPPPTSGAPPPPPPPP